MPEAQTLEPSPQFDLETGTRELILPDHISDNSLSIADKCRKKHYFGHGLALSHAARSQDLVAGGAFARGVEVVRREYYGPGPNKGDLTSCFKPAFEAFCVEWGDFEPFDERNPKTLDRTWSAVMEYFLHHNPANDIIQPVMNSDATPAVEFSFSVPMEDFPKHPVTGSPFVLVGRFDMLGIYGDSRLVIVDEKTTKQMGPKWADQWQLRSQFLAYAWALRQLGYDVHGAMIRGIAIQKTQIKFATASISCPEWQVRDWEDHAHDVLDRLTTSYIRQHWPKAFGGPCLDFGGCQFRNLCTSKDPGPWMKEFSVIRRDPLTGKPIASNSGESS